MAGIALYWLSRRVELRRLAIGATVLTLTLTSAVSLMHLDQAEGLGLDVHFLHIAAADAMAEGRNPYTDAVEVEDGSPDAEPGDTIVGYPYPPVTAIAYAIGFWIFSEPRITSLLAWLLVLALFGVHAYRNRSRRSLYLMLILASVPGWPLVLRASWTEPLTLSLLALAFFLWRKTPWSGTALGLGLASKQYLIVSAPVALLHRDQGWLRRLLIAITVVVVTIGAAMVLDFSAFWTAAVEFHTSTSPRFDSSNLIGLLAGFGFEWTPPRLLGLVVGLIAATLTGRLSRSATTYVVATALALASSFLVSTQAFANYWYLIFGLCVLGLTARSEARTG
jgi:hypothetical protein